MKNVWKDSDFVGQIASDMQCDVSVVQEWVDAQKLSEDGYVLNQEHGSPFDRGAADSYYRRFYQPHWYPNGTYNGKPIEMDDMTNYELMEYSLGFYSNELLQNFKEYE